MIPNDTQSKERNHMDEADLRAMISAKTGHPVSDEEVQDFLHDEIKYEERIGLHDVVHCSRCKKETKI